MTRNAASRRRAARSARADHRHERRDDRRTELVDAAVRVIRREGAGASMDQIAAEAGITKPIVYRHFGDRDGLVGAVAERFVAALLEELRQALSSDAGPREMLAATIDAYLGFVERDPEIYRFLLGQARAATPSAGSEVGGFIRQIGHEVTLVVGEQLRRSGSDSGAAEPWAFGMVGMAHLAGDWWLERRTMPRARLVEYLTTLLWDGLSGIAPAPAVSLAPTRDRKEAG